MSRRGARWGIRFAVLVAAALGGLAVYGFIEGRDEAARDAREQRSSAAPRFVSTADGTLVIALDAAAQRDDGIAIVTLTNAPHQEQLRAYGTVVDLGPLTELGNRHADARAQLDIAQAKFAASRAAFERARTLFKDRQNISAAELQSAEAAFRVDQAGLAAAQSRLRTLAITAQQDWGAALGQAVIADTPLLQRLMTRQEMLVQVTLRPGQTIIEPPADASVRVGNGSRVPLHYVSAATKTDPRIQGLSFFLTAPAESGLLPGMSIVAFLPAGPAIEGAVVPPSAIVWEEGRAWAYFRIGPGSFARRAIATERRASEGGYVVQGIPDNAELVVVGAQMLLSEEFRGKSRAAPEGDED